MKINKFIIGSLLVVTLAGFAACGKDTGKANSGPAITQEKPAREIVITANDQMKFSVESFSVMPGERIRLVLKNVGEMPKFSMGHNLIILTKGTDSKAFVDKAMNAAANDYVPQNSEGSIIAHTKLLGGGEQDSVEFTAPRSTGSYDFLCAFPGHFQVGMKGKMKVQ